MRTGEKNLLLAVRNELRRVNGWNAAQCEIEFDEQAPATSGDTYITVLTGGWQPGPRHRSSGGVNDLIYAVEIVVVKRITSVPRDRTRNVFFNNLAALTEEMDKIYEVQDFEYTTMNAANALILAETGSTEGFVEPLKFQGIERRPRVIPAEYFGATNDPRTGLGRAIYFGGARRITNK